MLITFLLECTKRINKQKRSKHSVNSAKQIWQAVLGNLELSLSKANFTTWFKNTSVLDQTGEKIIVGVPNTFTKEWLTNKYNPDILKAIRNINPEIKHVEYQISSPLAVKTEVVGKTAGIVDSVQSSKEVYYPKTLALNSGLNPKYNFQNFIVGSNNELAAAAAQAITKNPGKAYNPLFIYGGVGLGKTHLMQSIGNTLLKNGDAKRVLYVTTEKFTNEFIQAVRDNRGESFKNLYRSVDLLLIDDVQFLAGKEKTQEEFFHTFNTL